MTVINASAAASVNASVAAALALMTVITQLLLMNKINFHSLLYLGQVERPHIKG